MELEWIHQNFPNVLPCYPCEVGVGRGQTDSASPRQLYATSHCFQLGCQHFADQICFFTSHVYSVFHPELCQTVFYRKYCNNAWHMFFILFCKNKTMSGRSLMQGKEVCRTKSPNAVSLQPKSLWSCRNVIAPMWYFKKVAWTRFANHKVKRKKIYRYEDLEEEIERYEQGQEFEW